MHNTLKSVRGATLFLSLSLFLVCLSILFQPNCFAQSEKPWRPEGPITIIVQTYGGAYDLTARQIAQVLPDYLGQRVIVQAVTGANGANAIDALHRSKPDGRTLCLVPLGAHIGLAIEKLYAWDIKDIPVLLGIEVPPYAILSSAKAPYTTYEELLKARKEVRIATGAGNFSILPLIMDLEKRGVQYKAARLKGSVDAALMVIAGNADLTMGALSGVHLDQVRNGDVRPLFIYSTKRYSEAPNVPTHAEIGMPKEWANYRPVRMIYIPPGTPEKIQKGLKDALQKALQDKRTLEWSKKADTPVDIVPEEEYKARIYYIVEGFKKYPKIIEMLF
ncbi:MAG: Bug family tripartite tricarboxylate transporter substrate binding protein [Thermodesulfobacteriota bacterium]